MGKNAPKISRSLRPQTVKPLREVCIPFPEDESLLLCVGFKKPRSVEQGRMLLSYLFFKRLFVIIAVKFISVKFVVFVAVEVILEPFKEDTADALILFIIVDRDKCLFVVRVFKF